MDRLTQSYLEPLWITKNKVVNDMRLLSDYILLSGSASRSCDVEKLSMAHAAVRELTFAALEEGADLIVFASGEPLAPNDLGLPLVFDWTILRSMEDFLNKQVPQHLSGIRAIIVTSNKAISQKMTPANRELLTRLSGRNAVDIVYIDDDHHTGGNIRDAQIERATAMVAIGGGKGVADLAAKLTRRGKPVLPLDISIGALSEDGGGALSLYKRLLAETKTYFPQTHVRVRARIPSLSLEIKSADPIVVARAVIDVIAAERTAAITSAPEITILTALPVELAAVKAALGISEVTPAVLESGTQYWQCSVRSRNRDSLGVILSCIGAAGNVDSAVSAAEIVNAFHPRMLIMVGIAAGIRGKIRLGEVVLAERIVAYEPAALIASPGPSEEPRPEQFRLNHSVLQMVTAYLSHGQPLFERLAAKLSASSVKHSKGTSDEDIAEGLWVRTSTIASGEKLLRDSNRLMKMKTDLHGKIEAAEMEAAGIARACNRTNTSYLVVRGISDFGDGTKNDGAHALAATAGAIVAVDFIEHAYTRII